MTCLYDPRPLESPDYWELVWDSFAQFCDYVADGIKEQYGVTVEPMDVENNFYAKREYQYGDLDEAIRCIAEYDLFWSEEDDAN